MTSVCQKKKKKRLSWVLPFGARSKPEIQQNQVSSHLPQTDLGVRSERKPPPWTLTPTPTFTKKIPTGLESNIALGEAWGHRREGKRGLWLGTTVRITRILQKTTLGFGEKRFYEKLSHKKKSRNCIELRKWHYIITQFLAQQAHHQKGSVWF